MADDLEIQQRYIENLKKSNKEFADLHKNLDSTAKSLLDNAKNAKDRSLAEKALKEQYQKELAVVKKKYGEESAQYKVTRDRFRENLRSARMYSRAVDKNTAGMGKFARFTTRASLALEGFSKTIFGKIFGSAFDLGKRFIDAGERIDEFGDVAKSFKDIPFAGKAISALAESADFNVGVFKQLAQTGATFNSSIIDLRNAAHAAGMPILDFVDMVSKNSEVMAQLFGTVDSGVKRMSQFQRALRTTTQEQFAQFGLNLKETSEYFQTYLMLERARGRLVLGNTEEEIARSGHYIKNLVRLSKITGENIDAIDKRNRELAANGVLQSQLLNLGEKERANINNAIAAYGGADTAIGKLITQVTAFGTATETDTALLNEVAQGQLIPAINALKSGQIGLTEFTNIVGRSTQQGFLSDFNQALARAGIVTGEFTNIVNETTRLQKTQATTMLEEMKSRETATETLVGLKDSLKIVKAGAESVTTAGMEGLTATAGYIDKAIRQLGRNALDGNLANRGSFALFSSFDQSKRALRVTDKGPEPSFWERIFGMNQSPRLSDIKGYTPITDDEFSDLVKSVEGFAVGTKKATGQRFPNFGSRGTLVKVHGPEAIVPRESPMGSVIAAIDALGDRSVSTNTITNTTNNTNVGGDLNILSNTLTAIQQTMQNVGKTLENSEKHLNTLVGIESMVAKNTADTKKGLANMSASLV